METASKSKKPRARAADAGVAAATVVPLRRKGGGSQLPVPDKDRAANLVPRIAKALRKPGIDRSVIFTKIRPTKLTVYAYSVDPSDVRRIVREAEDGSKTVGRLVGNRFKPL